MADSFSMLASYPVTVILPKGTAAVWTEYVARADPSNVVFRFRLDPKIASAAVVSGEADQWASAFNAKANVSGVQSISTYQDIDANNQIEDRMSVVVESDNGEFTALLDMPQSELQQVTFNRQVEAEREDLNATAAL